MRWTVHNLFVGLLLTACTAHAVEQGMPTPDASISPTPGPAPTETTTAKEDSIPTETSFPSVPIPTHPSAPTPAPVPTPTSMLVPVSPSTTLPPTLTVAPSPSSPLAIESFIIDAVELGAGRRRLTFAWETRGASSVSILLRTRDRFYPYWGNLPPNGTHVFEGDTRYPNPNAELTAYDSEGNWVEEGLRLDWPCRHQYFFTAETETDCSTQAVPHRLCHCPRHAAILTQAAEQPFENGRMIWVQGIDDELSYPNTIVVLYDDVIHEDYTNLYYAEIYRDTWTPDQPNRDPDLTPPPGRYQAIRGFGKLWRENASVRERIGWATAPEQGLEGTWQPLESESLGRDVFLRTIDGQVVLFSGSWMAGGNWRLVTP